MNKEERKKYEDCTSELLCGFDKLPLLTGIKYVADVLCERVGTQGEKHYDPTLAVLVEILDRSVCSLETVPGIERLVLRKAALS